MWSVCRSLKCGQSATTSLFALPLSSSSPVSRISVFRRWSDYGKALPAPRNHLFMQYSKVSILPGSRRFIAVKNAFLPLFFQRSRRRSFELSCDSFSSSALLICDRESANVVVHGSSLLLGCLHRTIAREPMTLRTIT